MTDEIAATVHLAFAFDTRTVDLDRARQILHGEPRPATQTARTLESIRYRPAPIRLNSMPAASICREPRSSPARRALVSTILDFAAISLCIRFHDDLAPWPSSVLAGRLAEPASLTEAGAGDCLPPGSSGLPAVYDFLAERARAKNTSLAWESQIDWLEHRSDWTAGLSATRGRASEPRWNP